MRAFAMLAACLVAASFAAPASAKVLGPGPLGSHRVSFALPGLLIPGVPTPDATDEAPAAHVQAILPPPAFAIATAGPGRDEASAAPPRRGPHIIYIGRQPDIRGPKVIYGVN